MSRLPVWPGRLQVGRIAVDQFATSEQECLKKAQGAAMVELDPLIAAEAVYRPTIELDADAADRERLALHDGAAPKKTARSARHAGTWRSR